MYRYTCSAQEVETSKVHHFSVDSTYPLGEDIVIAKAWWSSEADDLNLKWDAAIVLDSTETLVASK